MSATVPNAFRAILLLLGAINVFLGLDLAPGGILTMGGRGRRSFSR